MNKFNQPSRFRTKGKNIFISYRERDSAGETGRLVDALKDHFEEDQIFMDIDKIEPGVDFTTAIAHSLECCDVMLAIIGPRWLGARNQEGSRIKDDGDWVRLEIATALNRNVRVVPVLVDGGEMPGAEDLPDDLQPLLKRQAYEISNKRWRYDTDQLIQFLEKNVGVVPKKNILPQPQKKVSLTGTFKWVLIIAGAFFMLSIILYALGLLPEDDPPYNNGTVIHDTTAKKNDVLPVDDGGNNNDDSRAIVNNVLNVDGVWDDGNGMYYLDIIQNGNKLDITSHATNGQQTGSGSGSINDRQFRADINVYNIGVFSFSGNLQSNKKLITGTLSVSANGSSFSEPMRLVKSE